MLNEKVMMIHLIVGLIKKIQCEAFSRDINVKVDSSNYETKADIKNISPVDTSLKF